MLQMASQATYIHTTGIDRDFLYRTQNMLTFFKIVNWILSKLRITAQHKTLLRE